MKTIRMKQADLDKWLTALRSGKYKQATNRLYNKETGGYCCLGVMQHCLTGEVENLHLPSTDWLEANGVWFADLDRADNFSIAAPVVRVSDGGWSSVADMNDNGWNFLELADLIEAHTETY